MKMNGLNMRYYWANFFLFNFALSMATCLTLFLTGKYLYPLPFFSQTGTDVLWSVFVGWSVAMVSLTSFVQIFIDSSKSATIIGYLLSIFSSLVGEVLSSLIYPIPSDLPALLLAYPPFALSRSLKIVGFSCANHSSCMGSLAETGWEYRRCLIALFGWFSVFLLSVWLNEVVQQEYGSAKVPQWMKSAVQSLKSWKDKNSQSNSFSLEMEEESFDGELRSVSPASETQAAEDHSVLECQRETNGLALNSKPLIVKGLSKKYTSSSNGGEYTALKPTTFFIEKN